MTVRRVSPLESRFARESARIPVSFPPLPVADQLAAIDSMLEHAQRTGNWQDVHAARTDLALMLRTMEAPCLA